MLPTPDVALGAGLSGLFAGSLSFLLAAWMRRQGTRVAYTRKVFHFFVFTGAALVHGLWGLPGTNAYGTVVAALVLVAVYLGDGNPLYEALARDSDRPHRSLFVVVPLIMTAVGGLASALMAGPLASVGYLVAGWGDAVGEPVGSAWGRHPYSVPSLVGVPAKRTMEGSAAVLLVGWVAAAVALGRAVPGPSLLWVAFICAAVGAAAEALSNHGLDNLTVQVAASLTALWLAG